MNSQSSNSSNECLSKTLLTSVIDIARLAGSEILNIYNNSESIDVVIKADDSPVTAADLAANQIICRELQALLPGVPVLSEESEIPAYDERAAWRQYWLVDPLDGTREFIRRSGEFTVNIALIEGGVPTLGVVYVPVRDITYAGLQSLGAFKYTNGVEESIGVASLVEKLKKGSPVTVVASRRRGVDALDKLLIRIAGKFSSMETRNMGSSLKLCLVAEGAADFYPSMAPTSEWDTAAGQAVVEAAGGRVLDDNLRALRYNTKIDLLNPYFYVIGDIEYDWPALLS